MSFTITRASDFDDGTFLYKTTESGVEKFIPKSVSEMKTLLGLPKGVWIGSLTMGNAAADPSYSEKLNTFGADITFTRASAGTYILAVGQTYAVSKGIASYQYKYSNVLDALPATYSLNISETSHGLQFQFLVDSTPTDLGSFVFVYAKVKIEKWED